MKRVNVKSKVDDSILIQQDYLPENEQHVLDLIAKATQVCGLPERPELDADGNPTGNILPAEYTIEIEDITAQVEQERINQEALAYLAATDWMVIRAQEDASKPVPSEVAEARQQARNRIVK